MERRGKNSRTLLVFALFLIWSMLHFLAPLSLPSDSVEDLSGHTGILDNKASIDKMSFPWNLVYSVGDRLCHQKAERSFFINDNQMPFCSRCTAIWLGMAIGLGIMTISKNKLADK